LRFDLARRMWRMVRDKSKSNKGKWSLKAKMAIFAFSDVG